MCVCVCVCVCVYTHDFSRVYCAGELSTNLINNSIFVIWRFSTAWYGTVRLSSGRFVFPLQFSTAIEWAGLFTRRYNCAASTSSRDCGDSDTGCR